jgi:uncharacterized protein YraI
MRQQKARAGDLIPSNRMRLQGTNSPPVRSALIGAIPFSLRSDEKAFDGIKQAVVLHPDNQGNAMTIKKTILTATLATLALAATAAGAYAAPAVSTGNVNVRTGPGPGYGVVDMLQRGESVDVARCRGSWCFVVKSGPDGWVSSSYLDSGRGYRDNRTYRDDRNYGYDRGYDNRPRRPAPRYRDNYDNYDNGFYSDRPMRPYPPSYGPAYPRYRNPGVCFGGPDASVCIN